MKKNTGTRGTGSVATETRTARGAQRPSGRERDTKTARGLPDGQLHTFDTREHSRVE